MARTLILVSPILRIPPNSTRGITLLDFPLPTETEIRAVLDGMIAANAGGRIAIAADDVGRERLARRARAHPQRGHQRLRAGDGERRRLPAPTTCIR